MSLHRTAIQPKATPGTNVVQMVQPKIGPDGTKTITKVTVKIIVQDFKILQEHGHEILCFKCSLNFKWVDKTMINWPSDQEIPADVWAPKIYFAHPLKTDVLGSASIKPQFFSPKKRSEGILMLNVNSVTISADLLGLNSEALRPFPFDSFRFDFNASLVRGDADFCFDDGTTVSPPSHFHFQPSLTSGEFELTRMGYGVGEMTSPYSGTKYTVLLWSLMISRKPTYYVTKGILPLCIIVLLAGVGSGSMDVSALGDRLSVILALFLTCFAIQWTILDRLPRIPYLTLLDKVIFSAILSLFVLAAGAATSHKVAYPDGYFGTKHEPGGNRKLAKVVDSIVLAASLLGFAGNCVYLYVWKHRRSALSAKFHGSGNLGASASVSTSANKTIPAPVTPTAKDSVEQEGFYYAIVDEEFGPLSFYATPLSTYAVDSRLGGPEAWAKGAGRAIPPEEF